MKINEAVELYIKLRDQKAELKAEYEEKVAPVQAKMDKLEVKLLDVFKQTGVDLVKTELGTVYTTTRMTASVADREVFLEHVKNNEDWSLLEIRASKTAVDEYREANDNQLPPGVNVSEHTVVTVRRSS